MTTWRGRRGEQYEQSTMMGKEAGTENGMWTHSLSIRCLDGQWAVEDEAQLPSWPETMKGLIPSGDILKAKGSHRRFLSKSDMTLAHSIQQTFIRHRRCRMPSALPSPQAPPTHTLSMSMRLLCRRLPSWSSRAFSSLICSASSGFKSNSAGNAEIQYLAKVWGSLKAAPHHPLGLLFPKEGERASNCSPSPSFFFPHPHWPIRTPRPQPGRGKPVVAHAPGTEPEFKPARPTPGPAQSLGEGSKGDRAPGKTHLTRWHVFTCSELELSFRDC